MGPPTARLLSWGTDGASNGKLWGWNPSLVTSDNDCTAYPLTQFVSLPLDNLTENIFCSGHSSLANGDLLITGGQDGPIGVGLRQSFVFRRNALPGQQWLTSQNLMAQGRWYPTNVTLPNGNVLAFAGTRFEQMIVFGGTGSPANPGGPATDDINRLGLNIQGQSLPTIPRAHDPTSWPQAREGHSAVWHPKEEWMLVFGGRESGTTNNRQDVWRLNVFGDTTGSRYGWDLLHNGIGALQQRTRHSAIMRIAAAETSMIVYGGINAGVPLSDVWKFKRNAQGAWTWSEITTSGSQPGARYGHAAVYDADNDRVLVFGGRNSIGNPGLADQHVYELKVVNSTNNATWSLLTPLSPVDKPLARDGHSMVVDLWPRSAGRPFTDDQTDTLDQRMVLFGGQEGGGGAQRRDVWVLWIDRATGANKGRIQWVQMADPPAPPQGPSARTRHAAFWDLSDRIKSGRPYDRMIISGGDSLGTAIATTWALDYRLSNWSAKPPASQHLVGQTAIHYPVGISSDTPDRYDAATNTWSADAGRRLQIFYPFTFVLPSGNLFCAGPNPIEQPGYRSLKYNQTNQTWSLLGGESGFDGGSAVTYDAGKIMKCGSDTDPVVGTTKKITFDPSDNITSGGWVPSNNNMLSRTYHNLTMLPTGQVLVTGGLVNHLNVDAAGVQEPQIWDPNGGTGQAGQWGSPLATEPSRRGYHSTALLLPDARIISGGGETANSNPNRQRPTIFCPPYLFNAGGSLASRPTIYAWSDTVGYGTQFKIWTESPDSILSVCLIRPGAVTHAFNQDQRFIPLVIQVQPAPGSTCNEILATAPAHANLGPPGDYLLFILKKNPTLPTSSGVPGIARWVRLRSGATSAMIGSAPPGCSGGGGGGCPPPGCEQDRPFHLTGELGSDRFIFALAQNQPNPFERRTLFQFELPVKTEVTLEIFDLLGRQVKTIAHGIYQPGRHAVAWDRRDRRGVTVAPGIYAYRLIAGSFRARKSMVILP
jgi:hypothetical protein